MATIKVRYLVRKPGKFGGDRWFWQPSGELRAQGWQPTRLPDDEAQAVAAAQARNQAVDAWRRGEAHPAAPASTRRKRAAAAPGSVDDLVARYKASRFYAGDALAPKTRKFYDWCLAIVSDWCGDAPARSITPALVQEFYARHATTPAKAAALVRVLRLVFEAGRLLGLVASNPAINPAISHKRRTDPRLWEPADVAALVAAADRLGWRSVGTAVLLNEWMGQRQGDVLRLPRWELADGALVFRQGKTKRQVALPIDLVPHLVARLQAEAARPGAVQHVAHLLVHDRTGEAWAEDSFRHAFAEVRAAAAAGLPATADQPALAARPGVAGLWFMWLRHTAVTRLNEAGCDALTIASITGHTPKGVDAILGNHYLVRTAASARRAFKARLAAEQGGKA
jgi:hypothetical protein